MDALDTSMQVISLEVLDQEDIHYKASATNGDSVKFVSLSDLLKTITSKCCLSAPQTLNGIYEGMM